MSRVVKLMVSPAGRLVRFAAGVALIGWGLLGLTGAAEIAVIVVGLVPLLAGALDGCVFAPLFGYPLRGAEARARA
jgi:Inner membrane protein YgaP-like, transmembrane domain